MKKRFWALRGAAAREESAGIAATAKATTQRGQERRKDMARLFDRPQALATRAERVCGGAQAYDALGAGCLPPVTEVRLGSGDAPCESARARLMEQQKDLVKLHYGRWAATYGDADDDGWFAWIRARETRLVYEELDLHEGASV